MAIGLSADYEPLRMTQSGELDNSKMQTPEQIVRKLHLAQTMLGIGVPIRTVLQVLEVSQQKLDDWYREYGAILKSADLVD